VELLERPGALLDTDALRELGLDHREVDRLLRALGAVVAFPDVRRVYVDACAARAWIEEHRGP
jgi:hypothetical protein